MLHKKALHELKEIMARDYGVRISDDQAEELGVSLLRLTRIGLAALARASEQKTFVQARDGNSLGAKTST
ncbi:MAG TPA: hypothetical protein VMR46_00555 [Candidatus Paceibacterota bacterium]|nr:hypothetical protein [Candidatus Paceibacterota bacterium]